MFAQLKHITIEHTHDNNSHYYTKFIGINKFKNLCPMHRNDYECPIICFLVVEEDGWALGGSGCAADCSEGPYVCLEAKRSEVLGQSLALWVSWQVAHTCLQV